MLKKEFEETYVLEFFSGQYRIWDKKKERFVGIGFSCEAEAKLFMSKLSYFLYDYENLKLE